MQGFDKFVPNNFMQAPLAGYTDVGFRFLCAKYGCGLAVTEMVSAMSLKQKNKVAFDMLGIEIPKGTQCKTAVQLFGHDADIFAEVVKYDEIQKFDAIDINMGCPVPKVVRNVEDSAIMLNAVQFAKMCQDSGASAITLHGRTREQMYKGTADRQIIAQTVIEVDIPVYANGDVKSADDAKSILAETNAFGVAIGRGALGKPWLYACLCGKQAQVNVWQDLQTHYEIMLKHLPEKVVAGEMKKHVAFYLKGMFGAKSVLNEIFVKQDVKSQLRLLQNFFESHDCL